MPLGYLLAPARDGIETYMRDHWALRLLANVVERTREPYDELEPDTREEVDRLLPDAKNLFYFGHGSADALGDPALVDATNVGHVAIVVAVACHSAERLGPAAIDAGTRTYVGFRKRLPVARADAYDALIVDSLTPLAAGELSAAEFRSQLGGACDAVEQTYLAGGHANAHVIALSAGLTAERLEVLGDADARC